MSLFSGQMPRKWQVRSVAAFSLLACMGAGAVVLAIGLPIQPLYAAGGMGAAEGGGISAILFGPAEGSGGGVGGGILGRNTNRAGNLGGGGGGGGGGNATSNSGGQGSSNTSNNVLINVGGSVVSVPSSSVFTFPSSTAATVPSSTAATVPSSSVVIVPSSTAASVPSSSSSVVPVPSSTVTSSASATSSSSGSTTSNASSKITGSAAANVAGGGLTGNASATPLDPVTAPSGLGQRPILADTSAYIVDKLAAQQLGKAFFWDSQAGSDGQACASCHFHAGADIRVPNQVNPGIPSNPDAQFHYRASNSAATTGPDAVLTAGDFPFHQLTDPANRNSAITYDTNDRFASAGTFSGTFIPSGPPAGAPSQGPDNCVRTVDPTDPFNDKTSVMFRRVEPRNTPSVINAAFNYRQFWDGRANNVFNGNDPFGRRSNLANPAAGILVSPSPSQAPVLTKIEIPDASLASQAVGPATSPFEMSCNGRTFSDIGRRILTGRALSTQMVHPQDSLLSQTPGLINPSGPGLTPTYADLIRKAFYAQYWVNETRTTITPTGAVVPDPIAGYNQMEHNFALFWGLAVEEYEALLVSDQTKFDRGTFYFTQQEKRGLNIFTNKGKCVECHTGPLFSAATILAGDANDPERVERMIMGDGTIALYDHGFYNIGVRPAFEDRGIGGLDGTALGFDLSFSRQYKWQLMGRNDKVADTFHVTQCTFQNPSNPQNCFATPKVANTPSSSPRDAVDGSFKVPILRNVGLTPPYFHNGGQATLHDVVDFYSRGGDRRGSQSQDTTGYPLSDQNMSVLLSGADVPANMTQPPNSFNQTNNTNMGPNISDSGGSNGRFSQQDKDALVAFLLTLTDNRVACHSGVFDHPELVLFLGNVDAPASSSSPMAQDIKVKMPAVGKNGLSTCFPNTGSLFGQLQDFFMSIVTPVP
jgi:cytochrome c peroxidase